MIVGRRRQRVVRRSWIALGVIRVRERRPGSIAIAAVERAVAAFGQILSILVGVGKEEGVGEDHTQQKTPHRQTQFHVVAHSGLLSQLPGSTRHKLRMYIRGSVIMTSPPPSSRPRRVLVA